MFHSYKVDILDKEFSTGDGKKHPQTARVHMYDSHGRVRDVRDYAYVLKEDIYKDIAAGTDIDLNNCYVKDFSLSEYRSKFDMVSHAHVEVFGFTAIGAFLDAEHEVDFSYCTFKGDILHFINIHFSCNLLNFLHADFDEGDKDFTNARFNCKEVNFQYADFNSGSVNFKDVQFHSENISFVNSIFSTGKKYFTGCDFGKANIAFQFTNFGEGDISFEKVVMLGKKIDFSKVEFGDGRVDFRLSEFGDGDIVFDECAFGEGKLRFRKAKFGSGRMSFELAMLENCDMSFERTEFGNGELTFLKCRCRSITFHYSHLNNYVDLRFDYCGKMDLTSTIVRDILDLSNEKGEVEIEEIDFSGMRILGRLFLDWYDNNVKELIYKQEDTSIKMKAEQFRMLKEEFRNLGQYNDEDKAYLEFKRLELKERKNRAIRANKFNALWMYPVYWGESLVFDQIGHYATNPLRVLVSMAISFVFITLLYVVLIAAGIGDIVSSVGDPDHLPLVTKSIYHSAITFLTIGYGDYYPSGVIRWLSGVEGFVGLFLMSYFTVAFVRKVLR